MTCALDSCSEMRAFTQDLVQVRKQ